MIRLPCENLTEFINSSKIFYRVSKGLHKVGQSVVLYNDGQEATFKIMHMLHFEHDEVLGLKLKGSV